MTYSRPRRHCLQARQWASSFVRAAMSSGDSCGTSPPEIATIFGARFFRIDPTILRQALGPLTSRYAVSNAVIRISERMDRPPMLLRGFPLKFYPTNGVRRFQPAGMATNSPHDWQPSTRVREHHVSALKIATSQISPIPVAQVSAIIPRRTSASIGYPDLAVPAFWLGYAVILLASIKWMASMDELTAITLIACTIAGGVAFFFGLEVGERVQRWLL